MGLSEVRWGWASGLSRLGALVTAHGPTGSHAYLTLALHWVEPREHAVPVVVSHNARTWQLQIRGKARALCACSSPGSRCHAGGGAGDTRLRVTGATDVRACLRMRGQAHRCLRSEARTERSAAHT